MTIVTMASKDGSQHILSNVVDGSFRRDLTARHTVALDLPEFCSARSKRGSRRPIAVSRLQVEVNHDDTEA